jgi:hypothetical protein
VARLVCEAESLALCEMAALVSGKGSMDHRHPGICRDEIYLGRDAMMVMIRVPFPASESCLRLCLGQRVLCLRD